MSETISVESAKDFVRLHAHQAEAIERDLDFDPTRLVRYDYVEAVTIIEMAEKFAPVVELAEKILDTIGVCMDTQYDPVQDKEFNCGKCDGCLFEKALSAYRRDVLGEKP